MNTISVFSIRHSGVMKNVGCAAWSTSRSEIPGMDGNKTEVREALIYRACKAKHSSNQLQFANFYVRVGGGGESSFAFDSGRGSASWIRSSTEQQKPTNPIDRPPAHLENWIESLEGEDKARFVAFLKSVVVIDPERRKFAKELLKEPWLQSAPM